MNKYSASTLFGSFSLQNPLCIVRLKIIITSLSVFLEPCLSLQKRMCNELPLLLIYFPLFTIFSFYRVEATLRTQVASTPIDGHLPHTAHDAATEHTSRHWDIYLYMIFSHFVALPETIGRPSCS
jgi:hypothetical protein